MAALSTAMHCYDPRDRSWDFGSLRIVDAYYPAGFRYDPHLDRHAKISMLLWGKISETAEGRQQFASPTSLVFKPEHIRHANRFGPDGARVLSVCFTGSRWEEQREALGLDRLYWRHFPGHTPALIRFLHRLKAARQEGELWDLLFDFLGELPEEDTGSPASIKNRPPWLDRMLERISDEFDTPLQLAQLADMVGLHPVYVARIFRKHVGLSVKTYIRILRLKGSMHSLASSDQALVHIALDQGFADQSHFSRVFKAQAGTSPAAFRRLVQTYSLEREPCQVSLVQD